MEEGRSKSGAYELPRWLWLYTPPTIVALIAVSALTDPRMARLFNAKEGPIEWATALVAVLAVGVGVAAVRRRRSLVSRWARAWVLAVTLGALYFAGEEVSWGQQIWKWESPVIFRRINRQGETNLHNISSWFNVKPRIVLELWVVVGGVLVPLWLAPKWRTLSRQDWRRWFWPTWVCAPSALLAVVVRLPDRIDKLSGGLVVASLRVSELQEFYFAYFLLVYLSSLRARLTLPHSASADGPLLGNEGVTGRGGSRHLLPRPETRGIGRNEGRPIRRGARSGPREPSHATALPPGGTVLRKRVSLLRQPSCSGRR